MYHAGVWFVKNGRHKNKFSMQEKMILCGMFCKWKGTSPRKKYRCTTLSLTLWLLGSRTTAVEGWRGSSCSVYILQETRGSSSVQHNGFIYIRTTQLSKFVMVSTKYCRQQHSIRKVCLYNHQIQYKKMFSFNNCRKPNKLWELFDSNTYKVSVLDSGTASKSSVSCIVRHSHLIRWLSVRGHACEGGQEGKDANQWDDAVVHKGEMLPGVHTSRGSPSYPSGHWQMVRWLMTRQRAPTPHGGGTVVQGSRHSLDTHASCSWHSISKEQ